MMSFMPKTIKCLIQNEAIKTKAKVCPNRIETRFYRLFSKMLAFENFHERKVVSHH